MAHDHNHNHNHDHARLAEILDLDAEVLHEHLADVTAWVRDRTGEAPRILDLGAGTGTGTLALARRFPDAVITAVDMSPEMLEHLRHRAHTAGFGDRIRTMAADLDTTDLNATDFGTEAPADLVWAANSLHHLADPVGTLRGIRAAIRPGGHLVALEMDGFPRFLPGDEVEARCHAAVAEARTTDMPHLGADWGPLLRAAGFTVEAEHRFEIDLRPPLPAATGRFAQATLRQLRHGVERLLSPAELTALDALAEAVPHRADLTVQAHRTAWLARP